MNDFLSTNHLKREIVNDSIGSGIFSCKDIEIGQVVMERDCFECVPFNKNYTCWACSKMLESDPGKFHCSNCNIVNYCSQKCQRIDTHQLNHKYLCKALSKIYDAFETGVAGDFFPQEFIDCALLLKISFSVFVKHPNVNQVDVDCFNSLPDHIDRVSRENLAYFENIAQKSLYIFSRFVLPILKSENISVVEDGFRIDSLIRILAKYSCNNFAINMKDRFFDAVSHGVFPFGSLANHSCRPNCILVFTGHRKMNLISIENISRNQEITISYVDCILDDATRRARLFENAYFVCKCCRCTGTAWKSLKKKLIATKMPQIPTMSFTKLMLEFAISLISEISQVKSDESWLEFLICKLDSINCWICKIQPSLGADDSDKWKISNSENFISTEVYSKLSSRKFDPANSSLEEVLIDAVCLTISIYNYPRYHPIVYINLKDLCSAVSDVHIKNILMKYIQWYSSKFGEFE